MDINANRLGHYESAFGKARPSGLSGRELSRRNEEKDYPTLPAAYIDVERTVDIEGERQWLGVGNDYGYGIHREKSDGLEEQIERELERRGFGGRTSISLCRLTFADAWSTARRNPRTRSYQDASYR